MTTGVLDDCCVIRTARKQWRCVCADPIRSIVVTYHYRASTGPAWTSKTFQVGGPEPAFWHDRAVAHQVAETYAASRRGGLVRSGSRLVPISRVEISERANPEHRAGALADACTGWIRKGDRYIEYRGECAPWESGSRYCLPCGTTVWTATEGGPA